MKQKISKQIDGGLNTQQFAEELGIDGGLSKRMPGQTGMTNTITVPSVDEFTYKFCHD